MNVFKEIKYEQDFGTKEIQNLEYGKRSWYFWKSNKKNNICDILKALEQYIIDSKSKLFNSSLYKPENKIGTFQIYDDGRPMTFEKKII
jgi:hypothetical protein